MFRKGFPSSRHKIPWPFQSWGKQPVYKQASFSVCMTCNLDQGLANYSSENCSLWAKSSLLPVFIQEVLLEHSHAHLFTNDLWLLLATKSGLSDLDKVWPTKPEILTILP